MPLTLYAFPVSQPSRAVSWFLKSNGIEGVGYKVIDLFKGEASTEEFKKRSVYEAVPILELEDGSYLTESGAILNYLATKFGKRAEYPEDALAAARVHEAQLHHEGLARKVTVDAMLPVAMTYGLKVQSVETMKATLESNAGAVGYALGLLNGLFERQAFVAGSKFTVADYTVACELNQLPLLEKFGLPESMRLGTYPAIAAYLERVKAAKPDYDEFLKPFVDVLGPAVPSA